MGVGRRKTKGRREPRFDAFPIPGFGLRLSPRDRVGGLATDESEQRRAPAARKEPRAANNDAPERQRGREEKPMPRPASQLWSALCT